jgi:DNA-binding transcriptional LysR family regulator
MEVRHFRYFAAVARYLNYSEASRRLHVAQPAVTQTILDLEEEMGVKLFGGHSPIRAILYVKK